MPARATACRGRRRNLRDGAATRWRRGPSACRGRRWGTRSAADRPPRSGRAPEAPTSRRGLGPRRGQWRAGPAPSSRAGATPCGSAGRSKGCVCLLGSLPSASPRCVGHSPAPPARRRGRYKPGDACCRWRGGARWTGGSRQRRGPRDRPRGRAGARRATASRWRSATSSRPRRGRSARDRARRRAGARGRPRRDRRRLGGRRGGAGDARRSARSTCSSTARAGTSSGPSWRPTRQFWREVIAINYEGCLRTTQRGARRDDRARLGADREPHLRRRPRGLEPGGRVCRARRPA